jgi:threonine/homoserine/homoserine lactone efflux protein
MSLFVKGLIVGFCLAAPVGPIAALCVQRTISKGRLSGLASGLGAATADALYGAVAAFGATIISGFLISEGPWLQRIGGGILILLGLRLLLAKSEQAHRPTNGELPKLAGRGLAGDFFSTLMLTLTNPMTFVAFAAIFTTMGIGATRGHSILTAELLGGVFLGSALWWTILSGGAHALRHHFDFKKLAIVNRATGIFVIAVGVVYLFLRQNPEHPPRIERFVPKRIRAATPTGLPLTPSPGGSPRQ